MGENQTQEMKTKAAALISSPYAPLLADLKARGRAAQVESDQRPFLA